MDRSNPFVQESLKDVDLDDGEVEMGDESEGEALPFNWLSPDELEASHSFTHKRDVFHAAVCFLRMILGSDVVYRYPDLATLLDSGRSSPFHQYSGTDDLLLASDEIYLPDALASVIRSMLHPSSKDRFTAKQAILGLSVVDLTRISGASLKGRRFSSVTALARQLLILSLSLQIPPLGLSDTESLQGLQAWGTGRLPSSTGRRATAPFNASIRR